MGCKKGVPKKKPANWKGGKKLNKATGYLLIKHNYHPNCDKNGYVSEHRLIMEKHLKRFLLPTEVVHHIDGNKTNNDIYNFMLFVSNSAHSRYHGVSEVKETEILFDGREL